MNELHHNKRHIFTAGLTSLCLYFLCGYMFYKNCAIDDTGVVLISALLGTWYTLKDGHFPITFPQDIDDDSPFYDGDDTTHF